MAAQQESFREGLFQTASLGELKQKAVRGVAVSLVAQAFKLGLRMGAIMILARLLSPDDFGLQQMVLVVTGLLSLFKDAGLSLATVQRDAINHEQTSTLFWINVGMGLVLAGLLSALAPSLGTAFKEPRFPLVAIVTASAFLFNGLAVQHQALLQRHMRFVTLAIIEISSILASALVGIALAELGYGYWALVGMTVSLPMATALGVWIAVPWIPGLPRRGCGIRSMLCLGGTWTFIGFIVYISYNVEKVLLARWFGAESLGLYSRAYQLIALPTDLLNGSMGSVVVPSLSRLQSDKERLRRTFLKCYSLVISLTIPITFACVLFAEEIIWVVLGPDPKWSGAALILRALAPTVLAFALINPYSWFLMATAQNRMSIATALLVPPLVILGILWGFRYGPAGVALGYSVGVSLVAVPITILCQRAGALTWRELWFAIRGPLGAGLLAAGCGLGLKALIKDALPPWFTLTTGVGVSFLVYAWSLLVVLGQKEYYLDILKSTFRSSPAGKATL